MSEAPPREPLVPAAYAAIFARRTLERGIGDWYIIAEPLPPKPRRTSFTIPITQSLKSDFANLLWWRSAHPYADMGVAVGVAVRHPPRPHGCFLWVGDSAEPVHLERIVELPGEQQWQLICVEDIYAIAAVYVPRNPTVAVVVNRMYQRRKTPALRGNSVKYGTLAATAFATVGTMLGGGVPLLIIALAGLAVFIYLHWFQR